MTNPIHTSKLVKESFVSRVDSLTQEQKDAMAPYAKKWIEIGLKTGETDWKTFDEYMPICYKKAGIKYPKNVVRVSSPLVGALAASIANGIFEKYRKSDEVEGAVRDAVRCAVGDAVGGAVRDAVGGAVRDAVRDAVGGAVDGAVDGAVGDAVGGAVRDAVRDAVRCAVDGAVRDAVDGVVDGAVRDAVRCAVGDAVRDAVRDAVEGAVVGAVRDAVRGAVRCAVRGAVGDAVRGAVGDAVGDAVGGAVEGAVGGAVEGAVGGAVGSAVDAAIKIAKKLNLNMSWHYWLGGQFWVGYGFYGYRGVAYQNFFFEVCGLKLSKDMMERAEANRKVSESVNYIWPNSDFVIVCARPKLIHRNKQGRLHCEHGKSIEYPDGWGIYSLNGVTVPGWLVMTPAEELTLDQFNSLSNADVKAEFIRKAGMLKMKAFGKTVDKFDKYNDPWWSKSEYELLDMGEFMSKVGFEKRYCPYLWMKNQTTGVYHLEGINPKCKTIGEAIDFQLGVEKEERGAYLIGGIK